MLGWFAVVNVLGHIVHCTLSAHVCEPSKYNVIERTLPIEWLDMPKSMVCNQSIATCQVVNPFVS